jgi:hypothetical protein
MAETTTLYRPVGAAELALIARSGFGAFPPRLPVQPIFYPVLNEEYAAQIARDWNTKDEASGYVGYVTRFRVDAAYAARFPVRTVGARQHRELWVPAEELEEFNRHLVGPIEVIAEFRGQRADGPADGTSAPRRPRWELWRQDDNGNRVLIRTFDDRDAAGRELERFESLPHRQIYWLEERAAPAEGGPASRSG